MRVVGNIRRTPFKTANFIDRIDRAHVHDSALVLRAFVEERVVFSSGKIIPVIRDLMKVAVNTFEGPDSADWGEGRGHLRKLPEKAF